MLEEKSIHALCPFSSLTRPWFAPAPTLTAGARGADSPKYIFIMKSQGAHVLGDIGVDGPILG